MEISKDERELYDRQIRLWGLEGQTRLRHARIILLGMEAVAMEVAKNLILAGVGSLTLQSSREADERDLSYNYFLDRDSLGSNVAEMSSIPVQRLNPRVAVTTETRPIESLDDNFLKEFDVVIVTQVLDLKELYRINEAVRTSKCAFYYALLHGWGSLLFVDLGSDPHKFIVEKEIVGSVSVCQKVSETQEIIDVQEPLAGSGSTMEKLTVTEKYVSMRNAFSVSQNFGQSLKVRQRAKVPAYLPALIALLENPEVPDIVEKTIDMGLPKSIITEEFLESFFKGRNIQLPAMAAVIGGTLSQEVVNFLTLREYPIQNTHVFDGLEGKGPQFYLSS